MSVDGGCKLFRRPTISEAFSRPGEASSSLFELMWGDLGTSWRSAWTIRMTRASDVLGSRLSDTTEPTLKNPGLLAERGKEHLQLKAARSTFCGLSARSEPSPAMTLGKRGCDARAPQLRLSPEAPQPRQPNLAPLPGHISNHVPRSAPGISAVTRASPRFADRSIDPEFIGITAPPIRRSSASLISWHGRRV